MAQRRMFSLKVVDTDTFLDMSPTAQNLYFHLGMRADDDGFISNPRKIMRVLGSPEDDMRMLITKNFIIPMSTNGVCVVTHWKVNNLIKSDRYVETIYKEEKRRIGEKDGVYTQDIPHVSKMVPNVEPQDRLGKDRLGKDNTPIVPKGDETDFEKFWKEYPKKIGKVAASKSWKSALKKDGSLAAKIIESVVIHRQRDSQWFKDGGQFIPNPATFLNQGRWDDEFEETQIRPVIHL